MAQFIHKQYQRRWLNRSMLMLLCVFILWISEFWDAGGALAQPGEARSPLRVHPLPVTLQQWQDRTQAGDYFEQIQPVAVGYLIWSRFPITVYVEPSPSPESGSGLAPRTLAWIEAVQQAVREWDQYLPLTLVSDPRNADITVLRSSPPLRVEGQVRSGQFTIRARAADARFEVFTVQELGARSNPQQVLKHRFRVQIRPDQAPLSTLATARHELGHALGIWGHSPYETDVLYASQVRQPPAISVRDINTLKRVYQQPTRLGWTIDLAE